MHFAPECSYNGDTYRDRETWKPYGLRDPCFECECVNGEFECKTRSCPPPGCDNAVADVGECCPKCPGKGHQDQPLCQGTNPLC